LKNNKGVGTDGISAELIKYGGDAVLDQLCSLIQMIWWDEEIPDEW